jgi:sec-independent protein translocase protein TatB
MIDFNIAEVVVLGVLAVIIFGPEKLPELARKTARVLSYLRNIANDAQGRLRQELGPEFADLELADLNPRALVSKHLLNPVQTEMESIKASADAAGRPEVQKALPSAPTLGYQPSPVSEPVPAMAAVAFDTEAT